MDQSTITLVQSSFEKVAPIADTAAEIFYTKLFEKDPSLEKLFANSNMKEQGNKLMTMLASAVGGLSNLDALVPVVQDLGKRHVGYGVTDPMYDTVGAALLETLEAGLGDDFTPDVKAAWTEVYVTLATVMKEAAAEVAIETPTEEGLTDAKIKMVEDTFAMVVPIADKAAEIFYGKLFEADPSLKKLFANSNMAEQGNKLMTMIGTAVGGLRNLDKIVPAVQDLGKRHVGYGVTDQMYDTVGGALLDTLEAGLGEAFTPEVKAAWTEVYVTLATVMKDAAATVEPVAEAPAKKWYEFWK